MAFKTLSVHLNQAKCLGYVKTQVPKFLMGVTIRKQGERVMFPCYFSSSESSMHIGAHVEIPFMVVFLNLRLMLLPNPQLYVTIAD